MILYLTVDIHKNIPICTQTHNTGIPKVRAVFYRNPQAFHSHISKLWSNNILIKNLTYKNKAFEGDKKV